MKKFGQEYISEFNGDDIHVEKLAEELGVSEFRFPDEYYKHAEVVIQQLAEKIIPNLRGLQLEQIGDYLVEHRGELFAIFDMFPEMHRLPLLVKRDILVAHGLLTAQLMGMNTTEFYNAFLNCMHFYLYLKSVKNLSDLYVRYPHIQGMVPILSKLVDDECSNEIKCAWGMRSSYFFNRMVPGKKGEDLVQTLLQKDAYTIPKELRVNYKRQKIMFWRRKGLGPERILLNISHLVEDRVSTEDQSVLTDLDVPALNFFLCQNDILGYEEIISKIFRNPDHTETWAAWIKKYFDVLMSHDSQAKKVFYYVFGLDGNLFENGVVPNRLKRKKDKNKKGSTTSGLPDVISEVLEREYRLFREKKKVEKKRKQPSSVVAQIQPPVPAQTAINTLVTRAAQPEKIIVSLPTENTVFPELAEAKKNNKQLTQIDLSGCDFPKGTTVVVERSLPAKKPVFEKIEITNMVGVNDISPVTGKDIQGHFTYRINVTLPSTHRFEGKNVFEISYYAKADSAPEELVVEECDEIVSDYAKADSAPEESVEQKMLFEELKNQSKGPEKTVPIVAKKVKEKVGRMIDLIGESLAAVALILDAKKAEYSAQEYTGGPIVITLSDADKAGILGDKDAANILPEHTKWAITDDNTITPAVSDEDVNNTLMDIARALRTKYNRKIEQDRRVQEALVPQQQEEKVRKQYAAVIQSISDFEGNILQDNSLRAGGLSDILKSTQESVFIWCKDGSVTLRFAGRCIISFNLRNKRFDVKKDGNQEFSDETRNEMFILARILKDSIAFIYADEVKKGDRKKMLGVVKERREAIPIYKEALTNGNARLMVLPKGYHDKEQKGLPPGELPKVIQNISWENIDEKIQELLIEYSGCIVECCLIKDSIRINGAVSQDDPREIADSTRGMEILKERIIVTLTLPNYENKERASIQPLPTKNVHYVLPDYHSFFPQQERGIIRDPQIRYEPLPDKHPYCLLMALPGVGGIRKESDITKEFILSYLNALHENGVKISYTHPYTLSRTALKEPTAD